MLDADASLVALDRLFKHRPVADLTELGRALDTRSRMSVFRRLSALDYLSSYSHTGRYYTLVSLAAFDLDGLWCFEGIGFSRDGTLKATLLRMVNGAEAGHTQHELQLRLGVRVHNPLLELVESDQLRREALDGEYVYVAAARTRTAAQMRRRRSQMTVAQLPPMAMPRPGLEVEVLLEVIHGARLPPVEAASVAARLSARGIVVSVAEVGAVFERHGVKKKIPRSRSKRSRH